MSSSSNSKPGYKKNLSTKDIYDNLLSPEQLSVLQDQDPDLDSREPVSILNFDPRTENIQNNPLPHSIQTLLNKHDNRLMQLLQEHHTLVERLKINDIQQNSEFTHMKCLHCQMKIELEGAIQKYEESKTNQNNQNNQKYIIMSTIHKHEMQLMSINSRIALIQTKK